jgi:hypothetical protein
MNFEKYELSILHPMIIDFKKITFGKPGFATHTLPVKRFADDIRNIPEFVDETVVDWFHLGMSAETIVGILADHDLSPELSFDVTGHREAVENWERHASDVIAAFEKDLLLECGVDDIPADMIRPVLLLSRNGASTIRGLRFCYSEIASRFKSMVVAMTPMIEHYRATKS